MSRILPFFALLVCAAVVWGSIVFIRQVPAFAVGNAPVSTAHASQGGQSITFEVHQGESAALIATRLKSAGIIQSAELFQELTALEGLQNGLAAGQYQLSPHLPTAEVIAELHRGNGTAFRVTIPEGKRIDEVAAILQQAGVVSAQAFLNAVKNGHYTYDFLADDPPGAGLEGYIFPDTYSFPKHNSAQAVVNTMLKDFGQRLTPALRTAFKQEGLTIHQAVTLASIVEREAEAPSERATIASVYFNRIHDGMFLDADPTVQFALASNPKNVAAYGWWKKNLTLPDLKVDSPYNTYIHTGLPPGPIANPGLASLEAVAHPASTNYLYFVAKGDGTHAFSETLAEQQANIAKYQP